MNSPVTFAISTKDSVAAGLRDALRGAVKHITWRAVGIALAIAIALEAWSVMDVVFGSAPKTPAEAAQNYMSATIMNLVMAFCIMFATLVADERVARGAKRLPAYAWAVVIGSAIGALAQSQTHQWLQVRAQYTHPAGAFFEYLIWGSIIVFIYANRSSASLAAARMNAAQVQRAEAQRSTLESRLQALQARVEPQFLFGSLARVRELYETDPAKGGRMLGDLIVYLRAALPHLRESTSTLGQEADLVRAYFNIMRVELGEHLAFRMNVSDATRAACMPPMLLLPLMSHALTQCLGTAGGARTFSLTAHCAAGKLRVEIADSGQAFALDASSNELHVIEDRLHALYGDDATLAFEPSSRSGTQVVMEIPHGSTDGSRR